MCNRGKKISIVINNYNYGRFINQAIDSALNQTFQPHEIIVVDDGSTDGSLQKIQEYGSNIILIAKGNGGQASAFNAGFNASSGDWIWFLDADDWLAENAVETVSVAVGKDISKIHGFLRAVNEKGEPLNFSMPHQPLSEGNVVDDLMSKGGYCWPPTSGNIFPRWALNKCMPMPEDEYRLCADLYICNCMAMFGNIHAIQEPIGFYRIHSVNNYHGYRMDATWLQRQAASLLTGAALIESLIKKYKQDASFQYLYNRRSVEMLMIAQRFVRTKFYGQFSKKVLQKKWWESDEIKNISGTAKYKGVIFWMLLCYAPKPIAGYLVSVQQKKAKRFLENQLPVKTDELLNR